MRRRGVLLCIGSACFYATGPSLLKGALLDGMGTWMLLASRLAMMSLIFGILAALRRDRGSSRITRHTLAALALGAFGYGTQVTLFTLAVDRISASLVVVLFNAFPILVVAASALTGREPLSLTRVFALSLGVGGVAIVALAHGSVTAEPLGVAMALGSGCAWAAVMIGADMLGNRLAPLPFVTWLTVGAAASLTITGTLVGFGGSGESQAWLLVVALAIVPGVFATSAIVSGVAAIGPALASILLTLEPPVAVAIAWVALGETLTPGELVGAALTLSGVLLARRATDAREAPPDIPP